MTIEEKAKAYDEALSVAQETYTTQPMYREWLAKMFPELKESEDERIRKGIIYGLNYLERELSWDFLDNVDILNAYAWLEKQGGQKSAWNEEDDMVLNSILDGIQREGVLEKKRKTDWLKSLRDRYTWKPSKEQMGALKHAFNDGSIDFADMEILATLYEQLKALHRYE